MNGLIYSILTLQTDGEPCPLTELLEVDLVEHSNGVYPYEEGKAKNFDHVHAGQRVESTKTFVSTRGVAYSGLRTGEDAEDSKLSRVIHNLLVINSESTEEEQKMSSYLELAYSKVFSKITSRALVSITVASSQPKFILITKNVPVFFFALVDKDAVYLVWSNEATFDQRIKEKFRERFYLYRMPVYSNGVCVIQSNFLDKRFRHWNRILRDKLKVMNALEAHLQRKWVVQQDVPVNISTEADHLVIPSTPRILKERL